MKAEFKSQHLQLGEISLGLQLVEAGNYVGISSKEGSLVTKLSDTQIIELAKFLNSWIEKEGL